MLWVRPGHSIFEVEEVNRRAVLVDSASANRFVYATIASVIRKIKWVAAVTNHAIARCNFTRQADRTLKAPFALLVADWTLLDFHLPPPCKERHLRGHTSTRLDNQRGSFEPDYAVGCDCTWNRSGSLLVLLSWVMVEYQFCTTRSTIEAVAFLSETQKFKLMCDVTQVAVDHYVHCFSSSQSSV